MARLDTYRAKRRFDRTPEPRGAEQPSAGGRSFIIQKHAASRLHYDLRLELEGVLKSWAVPKGPSLVPGEKRLAVHVEDHPLEYGSFEGVIPAREYGGGTVLLWDRGTWTPDGDPVKGYRKGHLAFTLAGTKLAGGWDLVRMRGDEAADNWLLIKKKDAAARRDGDILKERPESVATSRTMEQIAAARDRVWHSNKPVAEALEVRGPAPADPAALPGARRAGLPEWVEPQLATRVTTAPGGDDWLHEIKYDGYRVLCRIEGGAARFLTRKGLDWSATFAPLPERAAELPVERALLDGEVVALQPDGRTSFQALQEALSGGGEGTLLYYAFDLLHRDGVDLSRAPLVERKAALAVLLAAAPAQGAVRYSDHVTGRGGSFYREACGLGLEGIVSKRADAPYRPGRGRDWVKTKCVQRQEFVIGGWTDPSGSRPALGALLVGVHAEDGVLRYSGRVGTGFDGRTLRQLRKRLDGLARKDPPFAGPLPRAVTRGAHWVDPTLVAEVEFAEWTRDGRLRHPSFQGLREDMPAEEVVRETAEPPPSKADPPAPAPPPAPAKVRLTNPDRVLYPDAGITKRDLVRYYEAVADWILPGLGDRPLTLVRCPRGAAEECFYQKHADEGFPASLQRVPIEEEDGERKLYVALDSLEGLVALVQLGTLEFHAWNSRTDDLERPDRIIFDLDPGPDVDWDVVVEAARGIRERLAALGLTGFAKTTGGKGLHVDVPLVPEHGWETVKTFAQAVARAVARAEPKRFTTQVARARRRGRIYLDVLRNARGATAIAAYSTRARPGATVSAPVRWDELGPRLTSDRYTVTNLPRRLAALADDPWAGYAEARAPLTPAIEAILEEAG